MADKTINELVEATQILPQDLFVLQQENTAKKLSGQTLVTYLLRMIDGHGGVRSYQKVSTSGLVDTYRFTFADASTLDIPVTNGRAITSVKQTSVNGLTRTYTIAFNDNTSQVFTVTDGRSIQSVQKTGTSGLVDTYTITFNDGTKETFTVTNGAKGDKGDNTYTHFKFASQKPTDTSHSMGDIPDNWIGMYWGPLENSPTDWKQYQWFKIKGEKGDTGDPARLEESKVEYQVSDSGTIIPSGSWSTSIPVVAQGRYLWTRTTNTFNTGNPVVSYSVSRMGIDGTGSVSSVAGISPNLDGDVPLTADDVNALSKTGGDLTGELRMNGQPISGLNPPTADDQAANMGFVKEQVKKAAPYNYAHNSDFTQFVAQAGVGGLHGKEVYAGDRWVLVSGTISGDAHADGICYRNITLNGTIKQYVANAPDVGKVAIEMISGTANISYTNGEITITSSGGIIKNVLLCIAETLPEYQPKGYGAELAECQRYFYRISGDYGARNIFLLGYISSTTNRQIRYTVKTPVQMRTNPTVTMTGDVSGISVDDGVVNKFVSVTSAYSAGGGDLWFTATLTDAVSGHLYIARVAGGSYLDFCADLYKEE